MHERGVLLLGGGLRCGERAEHVAHGKERPGDPLGLEPRLAREPRPEPKAAAARAAVRAAVRVVVGHVRIIARTLLLLLLLLLKKHLCRRGTVEGPAGALAERFGAEFRSVLLLLLLLLRLLLWLFLFLLLLL